MYLSRLVIDLENRKSMLALNNPEILHGMIESCFPGERKRNLWRIDELNGHTYLLLLSQEEPNLTNAARQISFPDAGWETKSYQSLLDRIQNGSRWQFRLAANPVTSSIMPDGKRGKKKAITITEFQRRWLARQADQHGFSLLDDQFDVMSSEWRVFQKKGHRVSILCATFEGLLEVTDSDLFREALTEGIGRGKAYGMGLMTVMRHG